MSSGPNPAGRSEPSFSFEPTPAVVVSRQRSRFVDCSVCQEDNSEYLFYKTGVRFVRCRTCGLVYTSPVADAGPNYFDIEKTRQFSNDHDRALCVKDFAQFLEHTTDAYERAEGRRPCRVILLGRYLAEFAELPLARSIGLAYAEFDDVAFRRTTFASEVDHIAEIRQEPDVLVLHEFLEACTDASAVLGKILDALPKNTWVVATYSNAASMPARFFRRWWPPFLDKKSAFFSTNNLAALFSRFGFVIAGQMPYPVTFTTGYIARRVAPQSAATSAFDQTPLRDVPLHLRTGAHVAMFRRSRTPTLQAEKLSIVVPVFNEARYVRDVLEALLQKSVRIPKEIIIVESNSTDGTRDIVREFERRPGVKVIYEERPQGKGHAVKTGLKAVTGSIVLIQDADFEYDLDDYDALIEPILQRKASFVLGSRSLGLDDWKVRRFEGNVVKRFLLNAAQVGFAKTFNVLYQQSTTDVNTMFKVFRVECLDGLELECDGFNLDIELACRLVRNGHAPMEVPVNYNARGFAEGKKISFVRDAFPSYAAFFRYRFK